MFFDIGPGEFLIIAVVAVLIVGPERLPKMLAEGLKWLRVLRAQASNARREITAAADFDPALTDELRRSVSEIAELHPRRIVASLMSDETAAAPVVVPPSAPVTPNVLKSTPAITPAEPLDAVVTAEPPSAIEAVASPPPASFDADAT